MSKIRVGLIGCGKQAPKHIAGIMAEPDVEIVLADLNPKAAQTLSDDTDIPCAPVDELLTSPDIDAIDICTPTPTHAGLVRESLANQKHFFCEKPLASNLEEARELEELANESGKIGMVGFVYRFAPAFEVCREILGRAPSTGQSDVLGNILSAHFRIGGRGSHQLWKHRREHGGGAINEMLVHMIDLAHWFLGPFRSVELLTVDLLQPSRVIRGNTESVDAEDYVLVRARSESGALINIQADLITPAFTQFVELQGDNGTFVGSIQHDHPNYIFCIESQGEWKKGKQTIRVEGENLYQKQMRVFLEAVRSNRPPARCTIGDSVLNMTTLEAIRSQAAEQFSI